MDGHPADFRYLLTVCQRQKGNPALHMRGSSCYLTRTFPQTMRCGCRSLPDDDRPGVRAAPHPGLDCPPKPPESCLAHAPWASLGCFPASQRLVTAQTATHDTLIFDQCVRACSEQHAALSAPHLMLYSAKQPTRANLHSAESPHSRILPTFRVLAGEFVAVYCTAILCSNGWCFFLLMVMYCTLKKIRLLAASWRIGLLASTCPSSVSLLAGRSATVSVSRPKPKRSSRPS